jgi:hypothetical protein
MNRSSGTGICRTSFVGCCLLVLANAALPATETYTDALIPMVVLAVDKFPPPVSLGPKGFTWNGVVLATQPARPADAIVIDEVINKVPVKRHLFLALLGKPTAEGESAQKVWCKDIVNPNASIDCYEDVDGDGALDQRARGYLPRLEAMSLNRIGPFETIRPIAYRKVDPAEVPIFNIDYLFCSATDSQIKFARRFKKVGALGSSVDGPCDNVASPVADQTGTPSAFLLDQVRIEVRTADGVRTSQMTDGITPGLIVGHLRTDAPITDLAHAGSFNEAQEASLAARPDVYISTPPIIAKEPIRIGERLFSAEVKHRITGTLRAAAMKLKIFKGTPTQLIPAGARMYGIQMRSTLLSSNLDAAILWCYPAPVNSAGSMCAIGSM